MSSLATICIWAVAAGVVAGVVLHNKVPSELRARVERSTLRWGVIGVVLMSGPFATMKHTAANWPAEVALGLTVAIPLVVGVVLYLLGKGRRSGV
jgi:peptidoglycan/LPS O-acetylase OafA/YrhL